MSNKVIKFPNTPINQLSEAQKLALEMETEKNMYQENIEWMFRKNDWDKLPAIDGRSLDMLALFGDVMVFTPEVSQRIICKLAEQIKKEAVDNNLIDAKKGDSLTKLFFRSEERRVGKECRSRW